MSILVESGDMLTKALASVCITFRVNGTIVNVRRMSHTGNAVRRADPRILSVSGPAIHTGREARRNEWCVRPPASQTRARPDADNVCDAVDKMDEMLGSYGPSTGPDPYTKKFETEESPAGMLARGKYTVRSRVSDDDGTIYLGKCKACRGSLAPLSDFQP